MESKDIISLASNWNGVKLPVAEAWMDCVNNGTVPENLKNRICLRWTGEGTCMEEVDNIILARLSRKRLGRSEGARQPVDTRSRS